jgi:hypothetical protein
MNGQVYVTRWRRNRLNITRLSATCLPKIREFGLMPHQEADPVSGRLAPVEVRAGPV